MTNNIIFNNNYSFKNIIISHNSKILKQKISRQMPQSYLKHKTIKLHMQRLNSTDNGVKIR